MTNKNAAASAILLLMFASLLVIYVVVPQNDLVTFLSVVIMAIGLIIAVVGDREEVMMMAGLAGIVSLVAAYFWGESLFGRVGSIVATIAWGIILFVSARRASAETVVIPEDHAFMIAPFLSQQAYPLTSSVPLPTLPFLDRHIATIPTYELTRDIEVKNVNLVPTHNVDLIEVHTRYEVTDPAQALRGIPNRGTIQTEVAKELNKSVSQARLDVAFWEKLLGKQMEAEVDDIVRKVLFKGGEANTISEDKVSSNLEEAYRNRGRLSEIVQRELQHLVGRWGVSVREVALDFYITNPEILRGLRGDAPFKKELQRERERYEALSDNEAYRIRATGKATAERIRELVNEVKNAEPGLQPDSIEEIVVSALLAEAFEDSETLIDGSPAGRRPAPGGSGPAAPPDPSRNGKAR